jgi:hypothetical protein
MLKTGFIPAATVGVVSWLFQSPDIVPMYLNGTVTDNIFSLASFLKFHASLFSHSFFSGIAGNLSHTLMQESHQLC